MLIQIDKYEGIQDLIIASLDWFFFLNPTDSNPEVTTTFTENLASYVDENTSCFYVSPLTIQTRGERVYILYVFHNNGDKMLYVLRPFNKSQQEKWSVDDRISGVDRDCRYIIDNNKQVIDIFREKDKEELMKKWTDTAPETEYINNASSDNGNTSAIPCIISRKEKTITTIRYTALRYGLGRHTTHNHNGNRLLFHDNHLKKLRSSVESFPWDIEYGEKIIRSIYLGLSNLMNMKDTDVKPFARIIFDYSFPDKKHPGTPTYTIPRALSQPVTAQTLENQDVNKPIIEEKEQNNNNDNISNQDENPINQKINQ